jgi:hypothetical protein
MMHLCQSCSGLATDGNVYLLCVMPYAMWDRGSKLFAANNWRRTNRNYMKRLHFLLAFTQLLWARHEKSPEVDEWDWIVTLRMRTMLLLMTNPVSHIQTHLKSPTCCVFAYVPSDR